MPGIKYVIDPGTARISRYSYRTKVQRLPIEPVSPASANQRKAAAAAFRKDLYSSLFRRRFPVAPEFTDPEILRTNLASVILQMTAPLSDTAAFPFVEAPDKRNIQDGVRLLERAGRHHHRCAGNGMKLTCWAASQPATGGSASGAHGAGRKHGCVREAMIITSALSIQDPRERLMDKQQA